MWIEFWLVQSNNELKKYYKLLVFFWHFSKMKPTWFELLKILDKGNICHTKIVRKWWKWKTMKLSLITWRINICSSIAGKGWRLIKQKKKIKKHKRNTNLWLSFSKFPSQISFSKFFRENSSGSQLYYKRMMAMKLH